LHGRGAVPVWFVSWAELQGALADDEVTIPELEGMTSLVIGSADNFHETLQVGSHLNYVASGSLDDGGAFWVHASNNLASGKLKVQINLDR
jgi:hypothetical protein